MKSHVQSDAYGNKICLDINYDKNHVPKTANIKLFLKGENKHRNLGYVELDTKTFYTERTSEKHLHKKSKSYGFNYHVLTSSLLKVEWIIVYIDGEMYRFSKSIIDQLGFFMHYEKQGFELQRFLRADTILLYKNQNNEKFINQNPTLF